MLLSSLPDSLRIRATEYRCVFGVDNKQLIKFCKKKKIKYRQVQVLSRRMRGRTDLYGQPYQPTECVYVDKKEIQTIKNHFQ